MSRKASRPHASGHRHCRGTSDRISPYAPRYSRTNNGRRCSDVSQAGIQRDCSLPRKPDCGCPLYGARSVNVTRINLMKKLLGLLVILFGVGSFATDAKTVSYKSGAETVHGILYTPPGKGPFPAIIVIHEYWGLNDWVKEQASKLSDQGYVALAVDLYRGKVADNPELAHELMRGLAEDRAKRDLHAAFEFLQTQPTVKKDRVGSIGWRVCGRYSLDV